MKKPLVLSIALILLSIVPTFFAGGINAINLVLARCLAESEMVSPEFGYYGGVELLDCPMPWYLVTGIEQLDQLSPNHAKTRLHQIRLGLMFPGRSTHLDDINPQDIDDPFALLGEMAFQSRQGNHHLVIDLASSKQVSLGFVEPLVNDLVALASINIAMNHISANDWTKAIESLEQAIEQRPNDLLALYLIQQAAQRSMNASLAANIRHRLSQVGSSSFRFSDSRIAATTAQAIVKLVDEHIWDATTAYSKIASIVWQSPDSKTRAILDALLRLQPNNPKWLAFSDELAHRYSGTNHLINTTTDIDPLSCMPAHAIEPLTSQIIAEVLDVDVAMMIAGPNLLPMHFGDLVMTDDGHTLSWHSTGMAGIQGYDVGEFYRGLDDLCQGQSRSPGRLNVMWTGGNEGTYPAWAGWWLWRTSDNVNHLLPIDSGALYAFTFSYKTEWVSDGDFSVWLNSEPIAQNGLGGEHHFPGTDGHWHIGLIVGYGDGSSISPLFRLSRHGHVWIDNVQLRQIKTSVFAQRDFTQNKSVRIPHGVK